MDRVPWAVFMLLLLVLISPGVTPVAVQHLCGFHLVDALYFVCGHRGFYYNPNQIEKRDLLHLLGFLSEKAGQEQQLWSALSDQDEHKVKRGIVEQCCHKPCSLYHLEGYCD